MRSQDQETERERSLMEYFLVRAEGEQKVSELERMVNQLLKHGWELHGDTFVGPSYNGHTLYQAVVRKVDKDEPSR